MPGIIEQERYTCAIGAMQTVTGIRRAVPILHSGPGCGMMVSGFFERAKGYAGGSTAPCTNSGENEVVFGGEEKLRRLIQGSCQVLQSDLQVVLTGCTAGIVGDDVGRVVKDFQEQGLPIVHVETTGFKSNNYVSHSQVVQAIVDQYVDRFDSGRHGTESRMVNVFASLPYQDPFWKGNLSELKRLLEGIGLQPNILFGPESGGVAEWRRIPQAAFNILVSPWFGLEIVQHLEEKYGQPWFQFPHLPIGSNETVRFLKGVVEFADLDRTRAEAFIAREEQAFYEEIDNLATFLLEFRYGLPSYVHVIHDASYVLGMAKFLLHEVGIIPREQFVVDNTPEEFQAAIRAELASASGKRTIPLVFDPDAGRAQEAIRGFRHPGRGLLIGSGWDKLLAQERGLDFLSASAPTPYRLVLTTGYLGFRGGLRLIEDIYDRVLTSYK
ncbi:MAG: nitrogenase component 1 [Holophaga sp.]|nr:nitrogenase component 1 [Holophaga sp.]